MLELCKDRLQKFWNPPLMAEGVLILPITLVIQNYFILSIEMFFKNLEKQGKHNPVNCLSCIEPNKILC